MTWNYELFIDGAWTSEGATGSIEVLDPATEEVIGSVPEASTKTAVRAIEAARRAFDDGPVAVYEAVGAGRQVGGDGRRSSRRGPATCAT